MADAGSIIEPAKVEVGDQFSLKMVATTNQRLSFRISSAKTQSARFRRTPLRPVVAGGGTHAYWH